MAVLDVEAPNGSVTGYVDSAGVEDFVGHVVFTVDAPETEQHALVVGNDGYAVDRGGIWAAYDLSDFLISHARFDPLLLDSDIVYLKVQLVQIVEWGNDSDIEWPVLNSSVVTPIRIPRADGWSGRYCRMENTTIGLAACTYSFTLSDAHESWSVDIANMPAGAVSAVTIGPPDTDETELSFHDQIALYDQIGVLSFLPAKGHYRINGHRAAEFVLTGSHNNSLPWAGRWDLTVVGDYSEMSRADSPEFSLLPRPVMSARHDLEDDLLTGRVDAGDREFKGSVVLAIVAPDTAQDEVLVGSPAGYQIVGGEWTAGNVLRDIAAIHGIDELLRFSAGEITLVIRLVQKVSWATENEVPWLMPHPQTTVSLTVPEVLGWNLNKLHPRAVGIVPVIAGSNLADGAYFQVKIDPGDEGGTVELLTVSATDATGASMKVTIGDSDCDGAGSECETLWMCRVPQRFLRDETTLCSDLRVQLHNTGGTQARLLLSFTSDLDRFDMLISDGAAIGFEVEAEKYYTPIQYAVNSPDYTWRIGSLPKRLAVFAFLLLLLLATRPLALRWIRKSTKKASQQSRF